MNSNSSGGRLEGFLSGKGFYIVLFLCAAVIGVSAWMMAAGNETMSEDALQTSVSDNKRVETVIIPAQPNREEPVVPEIEAEAPPLTEDGLQQANAEAEQPTAVPAEVPAAEYLWPLSGELQRSHSGNTLSYDVTMRDWRGHEGIDIAAQPGAIVQASRSGTVESVRTDDRLGVVVSITHSDGSCAVYANLEEAPAVTVGQSVEAGQIIGTVGRSALAEIAQESHLHFALQVNGQSVDPLDYLQG